MKSCLLCIVLLTYITIGQGEENLPSTKDNSRAKRNAVGALHIVTNHADPIHADVKSESEIIDKPCPMREKPSHIEPGIGFQVLPPEDTTYTVKSLRKSLPVQTGSLTSLDVVRSVSRIATLTILLLSAAFEFYPFIQSLVMTVLKFITY